ncbi:hypothetical protein ACFSCZ_03000 [Siminovitchia sediminis]|uniref:Lipoprotein n=1 Tax=Siminovitchia sediminis TaxID=1274353 RepID=A0ABW4KHP9_9BACI
MKKFLLLLIVLLSFTFISACGTTNSNEQENSNSVLEETGNQEETNSTSGQDSTGDDSAVENESSAEDSSTADQDQENGNIRIMEQNLTYKVNGKQFEKTAFLKQSDNQDFSLFVLPEYELTGEEPRKDVLYMKENDTLFMRIELLPKDANIEQETETVKSQLESVSSDIKKTLPDHHDWLKNASGFTAENDQDRVSAYLIPQGNDLLKLTIFTPSQQQAEDPFLAMAKTIEWE